MNDDQITALAREYGEEASKRLRNAFGDLSEWEYYNIRDEAKENAENVLRFLLRRFCLVEKSKFQELEIVRRAKEHGAVWLNRWEAEYLFPEIAKEVEG